ncbi:2-deoxy-scyllo-inosamine dehydrogenase [Arthrobacter saudimassiliensis]|uniref:2-deoxy-scyllo-inosamine dehydrogenase n=1 Tax=Arthrobacter saudimassiliensis TaxID=1461584 RepID=A0A078MXK1_9MICC|nr:2-deoxy-scyllo-inosamine dehydrogenase [Arthrobacter saudimassiliensis]
MTQFPAGPAAVLDETVPALIRAGGDGGAALGRAVPAFLGPEDVELDVTLCGLCGSDIVVYVGDPEFAWVRPGTVLGHEAVGVVAEAGLLVPEDFTPGTRVVPVSGIGCGSCEACRTDYGQGCPQQVILGLNRHGAAAARCTVPARNLVAVPDHVPDETAVLTEPASVAWRAVAVTGRVRAGERVAVSATRAIGLLAALQAQSFGAEVTLVVRPEPKYDARRALAADLGLAVDAAPAPGSVDVWIEATGTGRHLELGMRALRPGGRMIPVAMYSDSSRRPATITVRPDVTVRPSYASSKADYVNALAFLAGIPDIGARLVTPYPLTDALAALHDSTYGRTDGTQLIKAALRP